MGKFIQTVIKTLLKPPKLMVVSMFTNSTDEKTQESASAAERKKKLFFLPPASDFCQWVKCGVSAVQVKTKRSSARWSVYSRSRDWIAVWGLQMRAPDECRCFFYESERPRCCAAKKFDMHQLDYWLWWHHVPISKVFPLLVLQAQLIPWAFVLWGVYN